MDTAELKSMAKQALKLKPTFKLLALDESVEGQTWKRRMFKVKCTACSTVEMRSLEWLRSKYGCMCSRGSKISATQSQGEAAFIDRAKLVRRKLRLVSPYRCLNSHIDLECLRCGHSWSPIAINVQKGSGCPTCSVELRRKRFLKKYGVEWTTQLDSVKEKIRQSMRQNHGVDHALQNKDIFDKSRASMEVLKDYKLGRRNVQVQGYEPQALDWILANKNIKPSQIECGAYNEKMPVVPYQYKGTTHMYHPDIFIPHIHLIVEVKSSYTYRAGLAVNEAKRKACLAAGFKFRYLVMTKDGARTYDY